MFYKKGNNTGALKSYRITNPSQDRSREFISLFACIAADGTVLPPALIKLGQSGHF